MNPVEGEELPGALGCRRSPRQSWALRPLQGQGDSCQAETLVTLLAQSTFSVIAHRNAEESAGRPEVHGGFLSLPSGPTPGHEQTCRQKS